VNEVSQHDVTDPVISLTAPNPQPLDFGVTWAEPGYTATDNVDGDLTSNVVVTGSVDENTSGDYTINYSVTDAAGNTGTAVRTVQVQAQPDTDAPVITLVGSNPDSIPLGTSVYSDAGATAQDAQDGDITSDIVVGGDVVDGSSVGSYTITYTVADAAGNTAQASRTVLVADTTAPSITILGDNPLTIPYGTSYSDPGATANDAEDGDLTANIVVSGDVVDGNSAGSYTVEYAVADAAGNTAVAPRTVVVEAEIVIDPPTITLVGDSSIIHNSGDAYTDLGATAEADNGSDLTSAVQSDAGVVASTYYNVPGTYTITYTVTDPTTGLSASTTRVVEVRAANLAPVITLTGGDVHLEMHTDTWVEPGYSAIDDGVDVTAQVQVDDTVDDNVIGNYVVTYSVTDQDDSSIVTTVTRNVMVDVHHCPVVEDLDLPDGTPNLSGISVAAGGTINYQGSNLDVSSFTSGQWASLAQNIGLSENLIASSQLTIPDFLVEGETEPRSMIDPSFWTAFPMDNGPFDLTNYVADRNFSTGIGVNQDGSLSAIEETVIKFIAYQSERAMTPSKGLKLFASLSDSRVSYPFDWHCALESKFAAQDVVLMASSTRGALELALETSYPVEFVNYRLTEMMIRGSINGHQFQSKYYGMDNYGFVNADGEKFDVTELATQSPRRGALLNSSVRKAEEAYTPAVSMVSRVAPPQPSEPVTYEVFDKLHNKGVVRKPSYPKLPDNPTFLTNYSTKTVELALTSYIQPAQKTALYLGTLYAAEAGAWNRTAILQKISELATEAGVDISSYISG